MPARQRIFQSLARKRDQPIPMVRLKRVQLTDNAILILDVRKQRHPAELVRQRLPIRHLCDGTQNRSKY